jgi:hypothetical protein
MYVHLLIQPGLFADLFIAKALELFMDRIIKAVADETKARGARRVTPSHLYVPLFHYVSWFGYHWDVHAVNTLFTCA